MLTQTPILKKKIARAPSLQEKLCILNQAYAGQTAYVITCGPTLAEIDLQQLKNKLRNQLVLCVKRSVNSAGDIADFFIYSPYGYTKYHFPAREKTLFVGSLHQDDTWNVPGPKPDLTLLIDRGQSLESGGKDSRLVHTLAFDDYLLSKTALRPWGPGIMYDAVFHFLVHLGVTRIVTIAWDLSEDEKNHRHFYAPDGPLNPIQKGLDLGAAVLARLGFKSLRTLLHYSLGRTLRLPTLYPGEIEQVRRSTRPLYQWLAHEGIELCALTHYPYLDAIIPRLTLDDL